MTLTAPPDAGYDDAELIDMAPTGPHPDGPEGPGDHSMIRAFREDWPMMALALVVAGPLLLRAALAVLEYMAWRE